MPSLTTTTRCTGHCCERFYLGTPEEIEARDWSRVQDGETIRGMIIHLGRFEYLPNSRHRAPEGHGWDLYTCRHFDKETRNCGIYDKRPEMCRGYPYGSPCTYDGCTWVDAIEGRYQRDGTLGDEKLACLV